jgi:subtilisin family serine protease
MKTFNISYSSDANVETLTTTLSTHGTVIYTLQNLHVIGLEVADDVEMSTIQSISNVVLVELDGGTTITSQTAWHLLRLVSPTLPMKQNYSPLNNGGGCIIYLMDSGIDPTHEEFTGSTIVNLYSYDGTYTDALGHGTTMACVINGQTVGVSKNSIIKNVKIPFGSTSLGQLLTAFDAILADHNTTTGVKVVNCSWTIPKSQLLDGKILELQAAGLVVVAAAGNSGVAADTLSPVGLDTVIGVGASDAYDRVISWGSGLSSNWGPEVDITAPGVDIPIINFTGRYTIGSGTSIAAAIVSGVVAQYIKNNDSLTAQQIQNLVIDSAAEDMLFRNESIYGTTPNRLIKALYIDMHKIWDKQSFTMFPVQRNVSSTLTFNTTLPLASASYSEFVLVNDRTGEQTVFKKYPWVNGSYSNGTLTLTVQPTEELSVGKYTIQLTAVDGNNITYNTRYTLGVYENTPTELDTIELEQYLTTDENNIDYLTIVTAACYYNADCGKGAFCQGGFCA